MVAPGRGGGAREGGADGGRTGGGADAGGVSGAPMAHLDARSGAVRLLRGRGGSGGGAGNRTPRGHIRGGLRPCGGSIERSH
eukprot:1840903-Pleurochrysis_carterae.AAC.2